MGIKFYCPNGHKLNVKSFLSGKKAICPKCGIKVMVPSESTEREESPGDPKAEETIDYEPQEWQPIDTSAPIVPLGAKPIVPLPTPAAAKGPAPVVPTPAKAAAPVAPKAAGGKAAPQPLTQFPLPTPAATPAAPRPAAPTTPLTPAAAAPTAAAMQTPRDAIDEAQGATWYVRPPSGGQFGPADGEMMRTWMKEGRVNANSMVWRSGWKDWQNAATVFPQLTAPIGGAPLPGVPQPGAAWPAPGAVPAPAPGMPLGGVPRGAPFGTPAAPMGMPVGAPLGMGMPVGAPVGAPMGMPVGAPVGTPLGMPMGAPVGMPVGAPMGMPVGQVVGVGAPGMPGFGDGDLDDPATRRRRRRRKSTNVTMVVTMILIVLLVALAIVLFMVLNKQPTEVLEEEEETAAVRPAVTARFTLAGDFDSPARIPTTARIS